MRKIINKNSTYFYSYTGLISLIFFEMILLIFLFILSRQQDLYSTTNTVVFDRTMLANANRDKILNILGHEFGHYSKEDNKTGTQTIANYSGDKLEDRTKVMVAKEATEDTLASIRNNPNVITGEEEYGWIWKVEGAAGVNYNLKDIKKEVMPVKFDFGIEGYEKKGKPIKNL